MESGTGFYDGVDGKIHYRWWSAETPTWVVLFAHGFGDHSGRWQRYGETLAQAGGAVFAPDHRGHGLSDGDRAVVTDFDVVAGEYLALRDVDVFPTDLPLILAGHSMGGLVVSRAALSGNVNPAGLAISGARLGRWALADSLLESIERGDPDATAGRGHPLLDPKTDIAPDALSRDTSIVQMFLDDDLAYKGAWPVPTLRATVRAEHQLEDAGEGVLNLPVLYMHGGGDYITPFRGSVGRLSVLVAEDLEVRIFPGARHSIFNEINRDEIFGVLNAFISRVI
jgi:alpha-beta hydrolase superfamily lysophospholipase